MSKLVKESAKFIKVMNEAKDEKEKKARTKEYLAFVRGERLSSKERKEADERYVKDVIGDHSHLSQAKSILANAKKEKVYGEPIKTESAIIGKLNEATIKALGDHKLPIGLAMEYITPSGEITPAGRKAAEEGKIEIINENVKAVVDATGQGGHRNKSVYVGKDKEDIYPQVIDGMDIPKSDIHSVKVVDEDTNEERGYKGQAADDKGNIKPEVASKEEGIPPSHTTPIATDIHSTSSKIVIVPTRAGGGGEITQTGITEQTVNYTKAIKEEEELQKQTLVNGVESIRLKYVKGIADSIKLYSDLLPKAQSQYGLNDLAVQLETHIDNTKLELEKAKEALNKEGREELETYEKALNEEALPPELEANTKDDEDDDDKVPEVLEDGSTDEDHDESTDDDGKDNIDEIPGGKADVLSVEDIAKKHMVSKEVIEAQIEKGISVEVEHTEDKTKAREIAMDHLVELPDYYDRLEVMEKEGKNELKDRIEDKDVDTSSELTKKEQKNLDKEPSIEEKNEVDPETDTTFGASDVMAKYTQYSTNKI